MNKRGQMGTWAIVGILVIAGVLLFAFWDDMPWSVADDSGDGAVTTISDCSSETTPSLNIKGYDFYNHGTATTEATNLYRRVGGVGWSTFTQGTGFAVNVGEQYEIVMGITTTDVTDNAYGDYFVTEPIPCEETPELEKAVYNDEIETSLSATFYNADGTAAAEVFVADQTQTVSLKLLAGTDEVFGNPYIPGSDAISATGQRAAYPNVVCLDLNSTEWDQPVKVSFDGEEMRRVSTPTIHSAVAGHIAYCYEAPVIDDSLMESNRYLLRLNADATVAPSGDETAYIYASNFFVNSDDGEVYFGVETEDGAFVGTDAADQATLDFT